MKNGTDVGHRAVEKKIAPMQLIGQVTESGRLAAL